jgi:hypothetical protein
MNYKLYIKHGTLAYQMRAKLQRGYGALFRKNFRKIKWAPWVRYGYTPVSLQDILNQKEQQ